MQSDGGTEDGNDFQLCLQAVDAHKWNLVRSFAAVDGEVARIHAQTEGDGVKFPKFDAAAGEFLNERPAAGGPSA